MDHVHPEKLCRTVAMDGRVAMMPYKSMTLLEYSTGSMIIAVLSSISTARWHEFRHHEAITARSDLQHHSRRFHRKIFNTTQWLQRE